MQRCAEIDQPELVCAGGEEPPECGVLGERAVALITDDPTGGLNRVEVPCFRPVRSGPVAAR